MTETHSQSGVFRWCAALTILLSAFLLFQVQPLISRTILPWFGGSPAVWTTCMLFFQVLLLGGYAYAHVLGGIAKPKWQMVIHLALLVAALTLLPITPDEAWKPTESLQPVRRILLLLLVHVGLPYFLLSSTGPLVQSWYARVAPGSPYRLYALSNIGSLAALISYPLLVEPTWDTPTQGWMWSASFVVFALLCGDLARRFAARGTRDMDEPAAARPEVISTSRWLSWLLLPALASVMLLAVTARLCQDIAVSPFMWVAPLSLYLLTFIICFDRESWYRRLPMAVLLVVAVLAVCNVMLADEIEDLYESLGIHLPIGGFDNSVMIESTVALSMLFFVCMVCHGELVRLKPSPQQLTKFYLMISAGGALGGVTVGLICPLVFNFNGEWSFGLLAAYVVGVYIVCDELLRQWSEGEIDRRQASAKASRKPAKKASPKGRSKSSATTNNGKSPLLLLTLGFAMILAGAMVIVWAQLHEYNDGFAARERSFYGVLSLRKYDSGEPTEGRALYNGRILHGYQFWAPNARRTPTTYYNEESGAGYCLRLKGANGANGPLQVGVIGLGAGTLACYGREGDHYRFYEINPLSIKFANEHFTFLSDCPAKVETVLGDGRISLENEADQRFDVLALDAFTGDSIPTHLLTREAMEVYQRHLQENGVICVHVSNRHLNLRPVVNALAKRFGYETLEVVSGTGNSLAEAASSWVLLTKDETLLAKIRLTAPEGRTLPLPGHEVLWTDSYSNLWEILR